MPESVERFAHPANTTQSLQHVEEPQSHSTFPNRLKAPSLTNHNSGFSISTVRLQPVPGIEDRNHSERLARQGHPLTDLLTCSSWLAALLAPSCCCNCANPALSVGEVGVGQSAGLQSPGSPTEFVHRMLCGLCTFINSSHSSGLFPSLLLLFLPSPTLPPQVKGQTDFWESCTGSLPVSFGAFWWWL